MTQSDTPQILVVAAEASERAWLCEALRAPPSGYRVREALSGVRALELCRLELPAAILLRLPLSDLGEEAIRAGAAAAAGSAACPVVVVAPPGMGKGEEYLPRDALTPAFLRHAVRAAIDYARLLASEQRVRRAAEQAAERRARLLAITAALAEGLTPAQVAGVILDQAAVVLGAHSGAVAVARTAGRELTIVDARGGASALLTAWHPPPDAAETPLARAVGSGEPVWLESRVELGVAYPQLAETDPLSGAWAALPLVIDSRLVGGLVLGFAVRRSFSRDDRAFMLALAQQCAQAVRRAELYEAERRARMAAEAAEQHQARLREAEQQSRRIAEILSRRLVAMQERERAHMARELHDEVGQALTAVQLNLQSLLTVPDAADLAVRLEDSMALVEQVLQQVRTLSLDLRPSMLDDLGLGAALRWYVKRHAERAGFSTQVIVDPDMPRLPEAIETACFRIAQEALTNVMRYAQASSVLVEVRRDVDGLQLCVADDGVGFDVAIALAQAVRGGSLGLLGMRERAALVGGRCEIESRAHQGTVVRAWFPID